MERTNIKPINNHIPKRPDIAILPFPTTEQIPQLTGKPLRLAIALERRRRQRPTETEQDFLARRLTRLDIFGQIRAVQQSRRALRGLCLGRTAVAGGSEVDGWVTAGAEVCGQEGEENDVNIWVGAEIREGDGGGGGRLAVVDC